MNLNDTTGINPTQAAGVAALEASLVDAATAQRRRSDRLKKGAIGTAKAVGYMAVGVGLTIGVQKFQQSRNQDRNDNQQGQ